MPLLKLDHMTVRFGGLTAVDRLDFQTELGHIASIIGPNGAGKTTVFNAITGLCDPTDGSIEFEGRPLKRPFTWRVLVRCLLVGIATGLAVALFAIDVDSLWRATVKHNYAGPGTTFSYRAAARSARLYWHGELTLERLRGQRWAVVAADGRRTLGYARNRDEASQMRERYARLMALEGSDRTLSQHGGRWILRDPLSHEILATYDSVDAAQSNLARYAEMARQPAARRRRAWILLMLGTIVGSGGAAAVWQRSRRTPDVIARTGIARTFQNIRLFQNMTIVENVLCGMDRRMSKSIVRMALRTPGLLRAEAQHRAHAVELLRFVGLKQDPDMLAKNLPYGDQRRLEIARALATEPRLILLDEPAAGMNPAESTELTTLIDKIRRFGVSVLLIEHHVRVVMGISDRIAVLDYGIKIAEGRPEEIRSNPAVIKAYLGSEEIT